ncbi:hypothetical protein [Acetobacter estunensis]|uniref:hypothetical protein n=1 Tax=Acetobacter estunensis TaxID=104097 RepID=UPI001C2DBD7E|nr:hypothetical protein [Acetobacter estunensis]MBV1835622.1 hypothetical protein [Acetobacter estunensis]MBV1836117.1 hypothetical protein [Acetobacter estunensis]
MSDEKNQNEKPASERRPPNFGEIPLFRQDTSDKGANIPPLTIGDVVNPSSESVREATKLARQISGTLRGLTGRKF